MGPTADKIVTMKTLKTPISHATGLSANKILLYAVSQ